MSRRRLRIAVVTPVFPTSAEPYRGNYNYSIVRSLQRHADVEVSVPMAVVPRWRFLQPRTTRYNAIDVNFSPGGVSVQYLPYYSIPVLTRPFNGWSAAAKVGPRLRSFQPDVVLAYWIYPEGFGALRVGQAMNVPTVVGALGTDLRLTSDPLSNQLILRTIRRASMVITVSEKMREQAIGYGLATSRVRAIVNGCDLSVFRPADRVEARRKLGIAPDTELILFVGWLSPTKGLKELIAAVKTIARSRPKIALACIGEGFMGAELRQEEESSRQTGRFRLLGPRRSPEISKWLAASDLLCLPSHSEGCPNVVLEALACGRPVVATRVGGIPEILPPEAGVLVAPRDPDALAAGLTAALEREWDYGRIAAEQSRSWHQVADETFQVCEEAHRHASRQDAQVAVGCR
jgi:teichuronic acid biosynthesis glycosyltransferase TuaC